MCYHLLLLITFSLGVGRKIFWARKNYYDIISEVYQTYCISHLLVNSIQGIGRNIIPHTFPSGNFLRKSGDVLVFPNSKSAVFTFDPLYSAAIKTLKALKLSG